MDASAFDALTQRLDRLERENRHMRLPNALVLAGLTVLVLAAQTGSAGRVVEAEEFVVKDARGTVRARLGTSPAGVALGLYHEGGWASIAVSAVKGEGANFNLSDTSGKIKGMLLLQAHGVGLYLSPVDASGPPQSSRIGIEVLKQGTGVVGLSDKNGRTRAMLGIRSDGSPLAVLQDKDGKVIWKAP